MPKQTTQEAFDELNKAVKELGKAIEYEIHILRTLETALSRLEKLLKELEK